VIKNIVILAVSALVISLPFMFRQEALQSDWTSGDPELVIITPHNEAIRFEMSFAFSKWHQEKYGKPVKIDWRAIGGTTEIMRYLKSEYTASVSSSWKQQGKPWTLKMASDMTNRKYKAGDGGESDEVHTYFRATDDPAAFTSRMDIFFGGGQYDHDKAAREGMTVKPWAEGEAPENLFVEDGIEMLPTYVSGEIWRTDYLLGNAVSTFGICYNLDRIKDLGVGEPNTWDDLADFRFFRQVGVADPTKSGSITKAFEMIIHQKCYQAVQAAGFDDAQIAQFEKQIRAAKGAAWEVPESVPQAYQNAVEAGWMDGVRLVQKIGGNARYFTDSATKVPIDISVGDAAVGLAIDFYGRYQAETSKAPDGTERMRYITPQGGSSVSCDPMSLLRGAPHREVAVRFLHFVLTDEGQRIWNYAPGSPGGPVKFALRRLPIRRSFYPSNNPKVQTRYEKHASYTTEELGADDVNPYKLSETFVYHYRWTGGHFGIHRKLIKAMCLDSGDELKEAWKAVHTGTGDSAAALDALHTMPADLNWRSALETYNDADTRQLMRDWGEHFRTQYDAAARIARRPSA
jgi:iron(III) transport system substrate-binding protein